MTEKHAVPQIANRLRRRRSPATIRRQRSKMERNAHRVPPRKQRSLLRHRFLIERTCRLFLPAASSRRSLTTSGCLRLRQEDAT